MAIMYDDTSEIADIFGLALTSPCTITLSVTLDIISSVPKIRRILTRFKSSDCYDIHAFFLGTLIWKTTYNLLHGIVLSFLVFQCFDIRNDSTAQLFKWMGPHLIAVI